MKPTIADLMEEIQTMRKLVLGLDKVVGTALRALEIQREHNESVERTLETYRKQLIEIQREHLMKRPAND